MVVKSFSTFGVCSLLTSMRSLGSQLCLDWGRPDGQTDPTIAESRTGGGGVEQKEEKLGTPRSDMACG